jgi:hypothetical protein
MGGRGKQSWVEEKSLQDFTSGLGGVAITSQSRMGSKEEYTIEPS